MRAAFAHCRMIYENGKPVDFMYLSVNPAFGEMTDLQGVEGKRVTEVFPDIQVQHPELFEIYGAVASSGLPRKFEYFLKPSKRWLSVSAYCPAKGYFVITFENITERKKAESGLKLFRALIDRSSEAIDVVDPDTGRFLDVNQTACQRLGYTREELLSMRVSDIDQTVKQSEWSQIVEDIRQHRTVVNEGCQQRKDGTTFPVEVSIQWVELDREYIVAVVRDVTERKRAEESLKQSEEQLHLLVEQAPVSMAMLDREMRYIITS
jgi:PAS domain S-box-containing protein